MPEPADDGEIIARVRRIGREAEAALRRHDVDLVARLEQLVAERGEGAALDLLDRDPQFAVVEAGADRIGAADVLAVAFGAQGQMLAGMESVGVAQARRHRERDRDRVRRFAAHVGNRQAVEFDAIMASDAFEIIERLGAGLQRHSALQAVEPNSEMRCVSRELTARTGDMLFAEQRAARRLAFRRRDAVGREHLPCRARSSSPWSRPATARS